MYNAVCYNGTEGFSWVASTQLATVVVSMIILTLRAACYEIESEDDIESERRCIGRWCSCWGSVCSKGGQTSSDDNIPSRSLPESGGSLKLAICDK